MKILDFFNQIFWFINGVHKIPAKCINIGVPRTCSIYNFKIEIL